MRSTRIPVTAAPGGSIASASSGDAAKGGRRVLVVDGPDRALAPYRDVLGTAGFALDWSTDEPGAMALLGRAAHTALVASAAARPDAVNLLRAARQVDLDVPLLVVTDVEHEGLAQVAVQQGALRFLRSPMPAASLVAAIAYACDLYDLARLRRTAFDTLGGDWSDMGDRVALEQVFARAFDGLSIVFQPIISWSSRRVVGHEALLRSSDAGLPSPTSVFAVAERLGRVEQVGRLVRERVARSLARAPAEVVFVNLHPHELLDSDLFSASTPLAQVARRVVLEISEHALLDDVEQLESRAEALRRLGFRLAIDNLRAGYPGLSAFARLRPDYIKLDQSLIRGVDRNPAHAEIIAAMTGVLGRLHLQVIAAGIESIAERDAIVKAGVDLLQGFAFSRPDASYRAPTLG